MATDIKDTIENFRKLIIDMRRGIPAYRYFGLIEQVVPDKEIRDYMIKREIFIKSKNKSPEGQDEYFLGVNGINLANSFEMERLTDKTTKLTHQMKILTWVIAILTGLTLIVAIIK
jgi:hypothetical protein